MPGEELEGESPHNEHLGVEDMRKRMEEERDEALRHLEQEDIENPAAAYWGGRYYLAVNFLLWADYNGPVFQKSASYSEAENPQKPCSVAPDGSLTQDDYIRPKPGEGLELNPDADEFFDTADRGDVQ